ncbi:MAG TPA: YtxH domain-containing protein [Gemmatimonadales bacterium]|nr:YtxH domain-containing protein [Gemmatimonadales bacterium]
MPKEVRPIVIEREASSSLWWFLVGGTLGAGLALLFAPHSGDRTRRLVGRKLSKLRDAADVALEDLRDALSAQERVHSSLAESELDEEDTETLTEAAEEAVEREERTPPPRRRGAGTAGGGTASARRELEQRLAEARARRHRSGADEDEEPVA